MLKDAMHRASSYLLPVESEAAPITWHQCETIHGISSSRDAHLVSRDLTGACASQTWFSVHMANFSPALPDVK